ncbi:BAR-domain-containing protein [Macrolepiota fuliginosa MF-IS2]|uniref:BAR-domain-containing protein n=1 Tax=Macrolepiota fuliginosa MF-IS2 TaxID=1400762 RepID=A0A9P5XQZ0_9AGAR|nr:BAR-domain-containing protein [Macrolepiota fuliginosa MF-IS2]
MPTESADPEFDDYNRHFGNLETAAERLIKDTKTFCEAVTLLFEHGYGFAAHFSAIFQPIAGEYDLIGKNPDCDHTIRSAPKYESAMEEMRSLVAPELELIEGRILGPARELQTVMKQIRKTITKREHKRVDYDRFNNSLTKLRDKKEKSLSDEKNLFKLEQDFEIATNEYEYINTALKQDMPRFMQLATQFIDPLFNSLFYMQLNIYYLILEKMNSFADASKLDIANMPGSQIAQTYEEKRTDAWHVIENMNIVKRIVSVSRLVQASRSQNNLKQQSGSGLRAPPPSRSLSSAAAYKKSPPPPPSMSASPSMGYAPPPYSPSPPEEKGSAAAAAAAAKRAPPPPPMKSKPKPKPAIQYVVALYDFAAQAEGDLSFNAGDRIELVQRTGSTEDWWTGRLNGQEGVFPGNYVQDT